MRNLEITADLTYDYDNSFQFEENFKILRYSGYREHSISIYLDYGNLSSSYDLDQDCIIEDCRKNRVKIQRYLTQDGYHRVSDIEGSLTDLIDNIGGVDYTNIGELYEVLDDLGIEYTSNYLRTSTRGYCQGDYAEILVNTVEYEEKIGQPFELDAMQKWFDHYFWDSPIYGSIDIYFEYTKNAVNFIYENEFEFNEWCEDEYEADSVDTALIIRHINQNVKHPLSAADIEQIEKKLDDISYTDVKYPCSC